MPSSRTAPRPLVAAAASIGAPGELDVTLVSGDALAVHEAMVAAAAGRNVCRTGGGELVGAFADCGLLDEIILSVAPVTLGGGAPLLPRRLLSSQLSLVDVDRDGQFVCMTCALVR